MNQEPPTYQKLGKMILGLQLQGLPMPPQHNAITPSNLTLVEFSESDIREFMESCSFLDQHEFFHGFDLNC
jgi:hypothetical protein